MQIRDLVRQTGEWLKGTGPAGDVVLSSRIRLARNLREYDFTPAMTGDDKRALVEQVAPVLRDLSTRPDLRYFDLETATELERRLLVERHLVSRELEEGEGARGVAVQDDESLSIMVNEEDHLRLQSLRTGLDLEDAWSAVDAVDTELSRDFDMAFDPELGFLTACPTNVGTGLRASVMVHLPALVMTRHIEKAFKAIVKLNLAVRGFYGEGTEAHGDLYQISNQVTLGRSEDEILDDIRAVIDQVVGYERTARETLLEKERPRLEDRVWRGWGALSNARIISSEETLQHLSSLRLGIHLGLLDGCDITTVNTVFINALPAHLQLRENTELDPDDRDRTRAALVREYLCARN